MAKIKKKKNVESETTTLEVARKAIIKKYGEGIISFLADHEDLFIDAVSTGCLALDAATGIGGFARGRLYEIFGPNSSGKSTLALSTILQAFKKGLERVVYVDAEHALDPRLIRNMGKQVGMESMIDKIELVQAFTGDDNLEIAEQYMKTGEVDILVIDSVSSLLPKGMAEGEIGDNYIGLLARLMSKACIKLTPVANRTNTLLIFVNQIRHDIGKWGDTSVPTGGEALGFYSTGRIKVVGGESKSSRIVNDEGVVIGHECQFEIIKNKLAAPWRNANIRLIYGEGYDFFTEVVDLAVQFGIIEKAGAWFYYGDKKYNGKDNLMVLFKDDVEEYNKVKGQVKRMLGLSDE
jgi:recombination protein RecA